MDSQAFSEWLSWLSIAERIQALSLISSCLTVCSHELFLPNRTKGKERLMIHMLQGVNELHHTLANWLTAYASHETKAFPVDVLNPQHWKSQNIAVTV